MIRGMVGRQIRMNGVPYEVIGILPPAFEAFSATAEVFVPIAFTPERLVDVRRTLPGALRPAARARDAGAG